MGAELTDTNNTTDTTDNISPPLVLPTGIDQFLSQRLDPETVASVIDICQSLIESHPEAIAVILFGSVARREERPLDDPEPSDVDLLLLLDPATYIPGASRLTREQELALHHTIGMADYRHHAPREIKTLFVYRDLERWDSLFIENVARDGILLWSRAPLPTPFAPIAERAAHDLVAAQTAE
jgi:predicted nucleotidyltransferase